jgi:hypothetical protein
MLESKSAFDLLNSSADPVKVKEWEKQEAVAQARRNVEPEAMDIYDIKVTPGMCDSWLYSERNSFRSKSKPRRRRTRSCWIKINLPPGSEYAASLPRL